MNFDPSEYTIVDVSHIGSDAERYQFWRDVEAATRVYSSDDNWKFIESLCKRQSIVEANQYGVDANRIYGELLKGAEARGMFNIELTQISITTAIEFGS